LHLLSTPAGADLPGLKAPGRTSPAAYAGKRLRMLAPFAQVAGKLPEHGIDVVLNNGGKPCPAAIIKQGGQAKIPFDNVSFFGDGFVSGNFGFGKAIVDIVFSHDAVGDLVHGKKVSIRGAGIDHIDFLIGMHAVDGGIGQIGRVTVGGWGEGGR